MTLDSQADVTTAADPPDRWWSLGPGFAMVMLASVGALELLILLTTIAGPMVIAVNGLPASWCPSHVRCLPPPEIRLVLLRLLVPLAILGIGILLTVLAFRGPKTVSRRAFRWVVSIAAMACPVLAWVWMFH